MDWQQYYPTYKFKDRDILLKEYESSARNVESQERIFLNAANLVFVVAAVVTSLVVGIQGNPNLNISGMLSSKISIALVLIVCAFSWLTVRYFADRQKSIIFDSRKIVILRKMLDLDYGTQQLVLPNWRIEGASNPFAIKIFPGWITYVSYPFWIIALVSILLLISLLPRIIESLMVHFVNIGFFLYNIDLSLILISFLWLVILASSFRIALYDTNERITLSFAKTFADLLSLELKEDFEYVIYRAKLAMYETLRMKINLRDLKQVLIFIEDRDFYKHKGISVKAMVRAFLGIFRIKRPSGGSTITQQLVRTLFIKDMSKVFRRKIIEIILALWFEKICTKEEILEIYLSSVRFEYKIFGITEAIKFFFEKKTDKSISTAEAFFLIERISNAKASLLLDKIVHTIKQMSARGIVSSSDMAEIKSIYMNMFKSKKLKITDLERFTSWVKNTD